MQSNITNNRREYSWKEGNKAEDIFYNLIKSMGVDITKSSKKDDIFKHIDFYIGNIGVDIKSRRHLDCIWLEETNVNGEDGWLKGESDYIVFDVVELKSFCFFKRKDLLNYVSRFTETTTDKSSYFKWYTRSDWGRKDRIIKVRHKDIKHLEAKQLSYATT
jgi:hypothetical protein